MVDLLPPNASALERAFAGATARIDAIPVDLAALWDPARCPPTLLPWLAWTLSIDRWSADWSDAVKRAAVASAIADQRIKGSRYSVERVLASFDALIELVEWFEAGGTGVPRTFEVRLPVVDADGIAGGTRASAAVARAIVADVTRVKPLAAHFDLLMTLLLAGHPAPVMAVQATGYLRLTGGVAGDDSLPFSALLQDENGEPLFDDFDEPIDGEPA